MMMHAGKKCLATVAVLGVLVGMSRPARACGGFFCSQVPIDQSGEQIIFSLTPNHVTAYIQISYAGAAKDFAWVVPVAAKPEITLGSQAVFQAVAQRTQPQFRTDWQGDGGYCVGLNPHTLPGAANGGGDKGVTVLDSRDVGPFQTVTLESKSSEELLTWLDENGFAQPGEALPLIDHYVQLGMLFVALRLKQDATAGEIQPIVLDMPTADPCVPLILTRIAAKPDMPVQVYVLGGARAVPENWFHVVIDLAKINWLQFGANYRQLVTDAINQAAGHGFVTEFAGSSSLIKDAIWKTGQYDTSQLAGITDPAALVQALLTGGYPRDAAMQALLRKWIPMPPALAARGVTEMMFYNNLAMYHADLQTAGFTLDTAGFIAELEERLVIPLKRAQGMFDMQPYLTRLLSTVSPEEMTRDPVFVLNSELPDVSNDHVAKAYGSCQSDGTVTDLHLVLEDGQTINLPGVTRFYGNTPWTYAGDAPAARRIELIGSTGAPVIVPASDVTRLDSALNSLSAADVRGTATGTGVTTARNHDGCGCTVGRRDGAGNAALLGVMGALVAAIARRRRRHPPR